MTNAPAKLREAYFFLRLLTKLEMEAAPLVPGGSVRDEFAFVLSGLLNAFYSATEHLKPTAGVDAMKKFKKDHPFIYDSKYGLRNRTVHERHVSPALQGYFAPRGDAVQLVFEEQPSASANLVFRSEYYFEAGGEPVHITDLCQQQYLALLLFAASHGITPEA